MAKKPNKRTTGSNGTAEKATLARPYFLSLTLENVRCFGAKQTLKLDDDHGRPARWTIILGNNGTGKTTLLQALAAFSSLDDPIDHIPYLLKPGRMIRNAGGAARFEAAFAYQSALCLPQPPAQSGARLVLQGVELTVERTRPALNGEPRHCPICYGYGAGRRLAIASMSSSENDDPAANLFDDSVPLRNAEEWLLQLDYSSRVESPIQVQQQRRLEQVKQLLLRILPEVTDLRMSTPSEQRPVPRVEFHTPYGWVHLRSLGYGYQTLVAWMVDLASRLVERYPDSADPLAEPAVVLVDEIDLHLHPQWQRTLIGHLTERFPNAQFIVTAHSPLVVQSAGDANLVLLRRDGDHVVIDNDVQSVHGWRIDQIYTSELFGLPTARPIEVEELLLKRRKLLEQSNLSEEDWKEVAKLEEQIGDLPAGETAAHLESIRAAEKSLDLIKKYLEAKP